MSTERHVRTIIAAVIAIVAGTVLSSCALLPQLLSGGEPAENDRVAVDAPDGWATLEHCPAGPNDDWVWVEGYPNVALEDAGIVPSCGDTWIEDDGENFESIQVSAVPESALDELGASLSELGYESLFDDFAAVPDGSASRGGVGARDYYLDGAYEGDFTRVAVEIYHEGGDPSTYTAYIDFLSPGTRALR
jgi:hypothetical protein